MNHRHERTAFTLIELLVVVAIVGVLVGILLPAVQKARESASRESCANNLKQLGLGLHNYHAANGCFPSAALSEPLEHGWAAAILPFIEQDGLYAQYDWSSDWYAAVNAPVISTALTIMTCPSAARQRIEQGTTDGVNWTAAAGDYLPLRGVDSSLAELDLVADRADWSGIMRIDQTCRLEDVSDGTAQTILLAEDAGRPARWQMGQLVLNAVSSGAGWASFDNQAELAGFDPTDGSELGPCGINCVNESAIYSFHPQGAQALFADGSVHFLPSNITLSVLAALVTRAGGDLVPPDAY